MYAQPSRIECPNCFRKFGAKVADHHIEGCKKKMYDNILDKKKKSIVECIQPGNSFFVHEC